MTAAEQLTLTGAPVAPVDRDSVYTPPRLADACVARLVRDHWVRPGAVAVEPSVGGGSFARALTAAGCRVIGVDNDPEATGGRWCDTFLPGRWEHHWEQVADERPDAVVGNPPFGGPLDDVPYVGAVHVEIARRVAPVVAFVLPAAWLVFRGCDAPDPWTLFGAPPSIVYPIRGRAFGDSLREAALFAWGPERSASRLALGLPHTGITTVLDAIESPVGWRS